MALTYPLPHSVRVNEDEVATLNVSVRLTVEGSVKVRKKVEFKREDESKVTRFL